MNGFNHTYSAILRDNWLIDPLYAMAHSNAITNLLSGTGAVIAKTDEENRTNLISNRQNVAIIHIVGPVFKYTGMCGEPGYVAYGSYLSELINDPNIHAIVISYDCPGGQSSGLRTLANQIWTSSKPIISFINDGYCCSGGYWLAAAAKHVVSSQSTDRIGSIGAYTVVQNYIKAAENNGIPLIEIYSTLSPEKNLSYREAIKGNVSLVEADLDELVTVFRTEMKLFRGDRLISDAPLLGADYNAVKALEVGLIDEIGTIDLAIQRAIELANKKPQSKSKLKTNKSNMEDENLLALANTETPDEATLEAANGDLRNAGITSVILVESSFLEEAAEVTNQLATVNGGLTEVTSQLETANASLETANARVTELEAEQATSSARIAELEAKLPGGSGRKPVLTNGTSTAPKTEADMTDLDKKAARLQAINEKKTSMNFNLDN